MACFTMPNFTVIGIQCRSHRSKTPKNQNLYNIFKFGSSCTHPLSPQDQIWHVRVDPRCTITCQISPWSVNTVTYVGWQTTKTSTLTKFSSLGAPLSTAFPYHGQRWHVRVKPWCTLPYQNSSLSVNMVAPTGWKTANFTNFAIIEGLLYPSTWPIVPNLDPQSM